MQAGNNTHQQPEDARPDKTPQACIVVLGYNRPAHMARVFEGLRGEGVKRFRVVLDAPATPEVAHQQAQIKAHLRTITWATIEERHHPQHLGLAASVCQALDDAFETHEAVIFLEDDCCPRPGAIRFLQDALAHYQANTSIRSVCAYQYPIVASPQPTIQALRMRRFCPWGWGTWRDRWREYSRDLDGLIAQLGAKLAQLPPDIARDCQNPVIRRGEGHIWSLPWILLHYLTDTWSLAPSRSLIDNIGFDGSGVHKLDTGHFAHQDSAAQPLTVSFSGVAPEVPALEAQIAAYLQDGPRFVGDGLDVKSQSSAAPQRKSPPKQEKS